MSRADLILNLVRAGVRGDQTLFRKTVEALAAEERAKSHIIFSERLISQLQNNNGSHNGFSPAPKPNGGPLVVEVIPRRKLEDLILPKEAEEAVLEVVEEQNRADLLRSFNLEPRHRVLLAGPPGNGKTSLAEALANALNFPLLVVRYEAVIGSYLGETAQRLGQVFEYARSRQCVLFFDEFDAVGKERGDTHETGEIKRVVSSLLLQVDSLPSYVVVVTASNHPELLDRAVWRRFQVKIELPPPDQGQIEEWFRNFERRFGRELGYSHRTIARSLMGCSFSEVEQFGIDLLRKQALAEPNANLKGIVERTLRQWNARFKISTEMDK